MQLSLLPARRAAAAEHRPAGLGRRRWWRETQRVASSVHRRTDHRAL